MSDRPADRPRSSASEGKQRSFEARIFATFDQQAAAIESIRGAVKSVQILLLYAIALAVVLYMLITKKGA